MGTRFLKEFTSERRLALFCVFKEKSKSNSSGYRELCMQNHTQVENILACISILFSTTDSEFFPAASIHNFQRFKNYSTSAEQT